MLRSLALIAGTILLATPATAADSGGPRQVVFNEHGHGWVLSDDKGMTLYTFAKDVEPGKSNCAGACAKQWPPLLVSADADRAGGEWSIVTREDGSEQWAYRSKPLYLYSRDLAPGDTNGDGEANEWQIGFKPIATPPGIGVRRSLIGHVLADHKGLTLYSFDKDKPDASSCDGACAQTWMPMLAPTVAQGVADWTVLTRKDGTRQWAFKGKPVYRYAGDVHPGETSGEKVGQGWHAVMLEPPPSHPDWVTLQPSDTGEIFADALGRTLYTFDTNPRQRPIGGVLIPKFDRPDDWAPVLADESAKPEGSWTIVQHEGNRQWAYKGMPLYTNKNDKMPGDLLGMRGGGRARLQPIRRTAGI